MKVGFQKSVSRDLYKGKDLMYTVMPEGSVTVPVFKRKNV
jgi:hypothetical protein